MNRPRVLTAAKEIAGYLHDVVAAGDSDRNALGFFPASVYADYGRKEQLLVLVAESDGVDRYAGHLLFDLNYPKAHVRQIHVCKHMRGARLGAVLLDALKKQLTGLGFISIHARVAEDLIEANRFWHAAGFYAQRVVHGSGRRQRMIVVRAHELDSPQLFAGSGITAADPLGLDIDTQGPPPLYLLDLNVLFDLGPRRERHPLALDVFRAERLQMCSLAISAEIELELRRTALDAKTDPMLAFAGTLARFPVPGDDVLERLLPDLAELVFPERARSGNLRINDLSDLKHLATAINAGLRGLITNDVTILSSAPALSRKFGLDVLSPAIFQAPLADHEWPVMHAAPGDRLVTVELARPEDTSDVQSLLTTLGVPVAERVRQWAATDDRSAACVRLVARARDVVLGYVAWPASVDRSSIRAHIAVREDVPGAPVAAHALLRRLLDSVPMGSVAHIHLSCPKQQAVLREVAVSYGCSVSPGSPWELRKVLVKRHLFAGSWPVARQALLAASEVRLPGTPPKFRSIDQQIPVVRPDGEQVHLSIFQLESLLSPTLLCLDGREGVMVPIQRRFEELLIAQSPQESFLPQSKAQLSPQRLYVSGPKTLKSFERGDLMFIYESMKDGGSGSIVAVGRVLRAFHRGTREGNDADLAGSIFTEDQLSEVGRSTTKTITVFDNVLRLPKPVPMRELKTLGCGAPQQLLTAQRLSSEQVQAILERGFQ